ncbi:VWA domain-containing protein [Candidatus Uhrbacteria bacterium]|nr:VWA domain-containing protein [Candidatus Uhrbacteria bacterium]
MKRRIISQLVFLLSLGALVWLPDIVFAASSPITEGLGDFATQAGFGGTSDIRLIIARLVRAAITFSGVVLIGMILYAGFLWMLSKGEEEKVRKARGMIINAVIGLAIILASFAIAQFVISSLVGATSQNNVIGGPEDTNLSTCATCPADYRTQFVVTSWGCLASVPSVPRNAEIQILFNRNLPTSASALAPYITVTPVGGDAISTDLSASGRVLTVLPDASCPSSSERCFEPATSYEVRVSEGLRSADGVEIACSLAAPCSFGFTTTDAIDTTGPTVTITDPSSGAPVYEGYPLSLQASLTDDSGVGVTTFTVDNTAVDSAGPASCAGDGPVSCLASGSWTPGNLTPASTHAIRAVAADCAGNQTTSSSVPVTALAPHCTDTIQNEDEAAIDCGGEDCLSCDASVCVQNSDCTSGLCVNGVCVTGPRIQSVSLGNGAPDNFVTIHGTGFGAQANIVYFYGSPDTEADDIKVDPIACPAPSWNNTQVVVAVPAEAADGAIGVVKAETATTPGITDRTDDDFGPLIQDFDVNDVRRPGLCAVTPGNGLPATRISVVGNNFGEDPTVGAFYLSGPSVYRASFFPAVDTWLDALISLLVPPSTPGDYDLQVFVNDEGSNTIDFSVLSPEDASSAPFISEVTSGRSLCENDIVHAGQLCVSDTQCGTGQCVAHPTEGGVGQYVTILGQRFGSTEGVVVFQDPLLGDVVFEPDFPAACQNAWWTDSAIVAQVPASMTTSEESNPKSIFVRRADYPTSPQSNAEDFTVVSAPATPGVCALAPVAGPVGTAVNIYGSNLGASASEVSVTFHDGVAASPVGFTSSENVSAPVPTGAISGPVSVTVLGAPSNELLFAVGNCQETPSLCTASQICCSNGSCAATPAACGEPSVNAQYVYHFSTGPIPNYPTIRTQCDTSFISPTPSTLWSDGDAVCTNAVVSVSFTPGLPASGMDISTFTNGSFYVDRCTGTGVDPCETVATGHLAGDFLLSTNLSLIFSPATALLPDTWYRATATTGIKNNRGVPLAQAYAYRFKTRSSTTPCEVEEVLVSPPDYTATSDETIPYVALPATGACVLINPDDYAFAWELDRQGKNIHFDVDPPYTVTLGDPESATPATTLLDEVPTNLADLADALLALQTILPEAHALVGPTAATLTSTNTALAAETVTVFSLLNPVLLAGDTLSSALDAAEEAADPVTADPQYGPLEGDINDALLFLGNAAQAFENLQPIFVVPEEETNAGQPALVTATPIGYSISDTEELIVNFTDPAVSLAYPQCTTACVNAEVGAVFNTAMQATGTTGLTGSHVNAVNVLEPNVRVFACEDEFCATFNPTSPVPTALSFVNDPLDVEDGVALTLAGDLSPSMYYRVMIWGGITSEPQSPTVPGIPLWGVTNPDGTPVIPLNYGNYYSWVFRTRDNAAPCGIGNVALSPLEVILEAVGDRASFSASVTGRPDSCAVAGQVLNPLAYAWDWLVNQVTNSATNTQISVATYLPDGTLTATLDTDTDRALSCSAQCLRTGTISYAAVCGDGIVNPFYEDCDVALDPIGCSPTCQTVGVTACANPATDLLCCGNGIREGREECDDNGNLDGNGCSATCLNEGSTAAGLTCNDGTISQFDTVTPDGRSGGEECEDSNTISGDGCSAQCLREGSTPSADIGVHCGNGDVEEGEDCDDGGITSGDGCSANCLAEPLGPGVWSRTTPTGILNGVCGSNGREYNVTTGAGEECDDGNTTSGDGCSAQCQNEGSSVFYPVPSFCGNGGLPELGEECEISSSADDGVGPYDPLQTLEIEAVATQAVVDGEVRTTLRATGSDDATETSAFGTAEIGLSCSCTTDATCGEPALLGCGVSDCCFDRPAVQESTTVPLATTSAGVCRNALVRVAFTQQMGEESILEDNGTKHIVLTAFGEDTNGNGAYDSADVRYTTASDCPTNTTPVIVQDFSDRPWYARLWQNILRVVAPRAWAGSVSCIVASNLSIEDVETNPDEFITRVSVLYNQILEPQTLYRILVEADANYTDANPDGVLSRWGVGLVGNSSVFANFEASWSRIFATGNTICDVDFVQVEDLSASPGLFTQANTAHPLAAEAMTLIGPLAQPIVSVPGVYAWAWSGTSVSTTWGWNSSVADPNIVVVTPGASTSANTTATASTANPAINGVENVMAQLRIMEDTVLSPTTVGRIVGGTVEERVFLCENPWPAVGHFPFVDSAWYAGDPAPGITLTAPYTNFSAFYCRDAGERGTSDDLPALSVVQKTQNIASPGIFKEFLFAVDDPDIHDAIGVRVLSNSNYLSPAEWFAGQGFVGSPAAESVDGFEGVRDGRTVYVSAPNTGAALYPNMYAIAYNEGASAETRQIYQAMLGAWEFAGARDLTTGLLTVTNGRVCATPLPSGDMDPIEVNGELVACSTDAECAAVATGGSPALCDADKDKLRRDLKRLTDVRTIGEALTSYGETHRHCSVTKDQLCFEDSDCSGAEECVASVPTLGSGTYIPSFSLSAWPSWQAQLANALGRAVPTDPLNTFVSCPDGYDAETCYNALAAQAICPADSHVYTYRSIGGEEFWLSTDLEFGVAPPAETTLAWASPVDVDSPLPNLGTYYVGNANLPSPFASTPVLGGFQNARTCNGATFTATNVCGDGLIGSGEICEVGETTSVSCSTNVCANAVNLSFNGLPCTTASDCGSNGSCVATSGTRAVPCVGPSDASGLGCQAFQTASTSAACIPNYCGDGVIQGSETCDDGPLNGQYGFCATNCTWTSAVFCGDGLIGGAEACDCGSAASFNLLAPTPQCRTASASYLNGLYSTDPAYGCAADCSGTAPSCGDGTVNGAAEECDGTNEQWNGKLCVNGDPCTTNAECADGSLCGDPALSWAGVCPASTASDTLGLPQTRTRVCNGLGLPPYTNACRWPTTTGIPGGWQACAPVGSCGNGIPEGIEECDDGDTDEQDACRNNCTQNVCGDGVRNVGVESCDLGGQNGVPCNPAYSDTCNYCSATCTYQTVTGGYCGDGVINGGEVCDGASVPSYCFKGAINPTERVRGEVCGTDADCPFDYTCEALVGTCNGGSATAVDGEYVYNGFPCAQPPPETFDYNKACGDPIFNPDTFGSCVLQDCNASCSLACPFTLEQGAVLAQSETAVNRTTSVDLRSYLSEDPATAGAPDNATLYFPACTVGSALYASVSFDDVEPPNIDLIFLIDYSTSMSYEIDGTPPEADESTRLDIVKEALVDAADELYDAFPNGNLASGIVIFNEVNPATDVLAENPLPNASFTASKSELVLNLSQLANPGTGLGTHTAYGLSRAYELLTTDRPDTDVRIVILVSDGESDDLLAAAAASDTLDTLENTVIYTVAFTSNDDEIAVNNHFSSDVCGVDFYELNNSDGTPECAPPADGVEYAYNAPDADGFQAVVDTITANILGLSLNYETTTGFAGGVASEGDDVLLPFPPGFECPASGAFQIPFHINFNGSGTVNLSDLRLEYCPQ